ncbi:Si-specific NAD(P)(+) transhydrogenase [bacterium]|nr:MAG: Si-specific NAD(P)(+) transhydrogenase [bacterium]
MSKDFDLIILGSGPAGYSASMQASKAGKNVLVVEANMEGFGGAWINTGTVPSKALREAAYTVYKYHNLIYQHKAGSRKPFEKYAMADLLRFKNEVMTKETASAKNYFIKNEIKTIRGYGKLVDGNTVEITDTLGMKHTYTTEKVLISTGARPMPPSTFDIDHNIILDSTSVLKMDHFPRRLVIIGAGVHALEFASIFAAMGTIVTVLNAHSDYLGFLDEEIKAELNKSFSDLGILIQNNAHVMGIVKNKLRNKTEVRYTIDGSDQPLHVIETEQVLYLGSRIPNTEKLGLESVGVKTSDDGFIVVDKDFKSSVSSVYAAGDVIGYPSLASASFTQGRLATCHMFDIPAGEVSGLVPYGIYTLPEISSIGLTEKDAVREGINVGVGRAYFDGLTRAQISSAGHGMLKLVFDADSFKLLGVHIIGESSTEIIHLGQSVISRGESIHYFIRNIINYPTYSQAYQTAAFNGVNRILKAGVKYRKEK